MNTLERLKIQVEQSKELYEELTKDGVEIGSIEACNAVLRMIESLKNEGKTNELHSI